MKMLQMTQMEDEQSITYMLFLLKKDKPTQIGGPIFQDEVSTMKLTLFSLTDIDDVQVLPESIFSQKYPKQYSIYIKKFWMDKLWCYFKMNKKWIGDVHLFPQDRAIAGKWFHIYDGINPQTKRHELALSISLTANPFYVSRLTLDLMDIKTLPIHRCVEYFSKRTEDVYGADEAVQKYLTDKCLLSSLNDSRAAVSN